MKLPMSSARTAAPAIGGLWSCMFLTLLVIPAVYAIWRRHQIRRERRADGSGGPDAARR